MCVLACVISACGHNPNTTPTASSDIKDASLHDGIESISSQFDSFSVNTGDAQTQSQPQLRLSINNESLHFTWDTAPDVEQIKLLQFNTSSQEIFPVFSTLDAQITHHTLTINTLLFNWSETQFILEACTDNKCTCSESVSPRANHADVITRTTVAANSTVAGLGSIVALNRTGHTMVFDAPDKTTAELTTTGELQVFFNAGDQWHAATQLRSNNLSENAQLGTQLAISDAGNLIVASAPNHRVSTNSSGVVAVFEQFGEGWINTASIGIQDTAVEHFGAHLALSGDASTLAVGAQENESIWLFQRVSSQWQLVQTINLAGVNTDPAPVRDLALSQDGRKLFAATNRSISVLNFAQGYFAETDQIVPPVSDVQQYIHQIDTNESGTTLVMTLMQSLDQLSDSSTLTSTSLDMLIYTQAVSEKWEQDMQQRIASRVPAESLPSLAMSADGHSIVLSVSATLHHRGYIHSYTKQHVASQAEHRWLPGPLFLLPPQKLSDNETQRGVQLKTALALSGDGRSMLVGIAREYNSSGVTSGSVYMYQSASN